VARGRGIGALAARPPRSQAAGAFRSRARRPEESGLARNARGVHGRAGEVAVHAALAAACLGAALLLLAAGGADAAGSREAATVRTLPITARLKAEIRASFYRAYRADPGGFGDATGLPSSAFASSIGYAGVVLGPTPAAGSSWVIGAVCPRSNPVPCQDAGAYQVYYRTGPTGPFVYGNGVGLCGLPAALAARWFPGGRYPLGITCPRGEALVRRGGLRGSGVWTALVPGSWILVPCTSAGASRFNQSLCSFEGGDTDVDIWFNEADTSDLLEVATCRGGDCFRSAASGGPRLVASAGEKRMAAWELSFDAGPGAPANPPGSGAVSGLLVAAHSGERLSYPVFTVEVELPSSQSALAAAIVSSFAACLKPGVTIFVAGCL
jgi:hypothetical protein